MDRMATASQSIKHLNVTVIRIGKEQTVQQRFLIVEGSDPIMRCIRVMNEMEYAKKAKLLMMLGQEAANVSLVGLVTSAMMTKMNAKLVLMRIVFNLMLRSLHTSKLHNK